MWRSCAYVSGVLLIIVALAAVPSLPVVESYVGGSAVQGSVEDGHYFVNPGHGRPTTEVSESAWRTVYWVGQLWPWSALVPGWAGLFLVGYGKGPSRTPSPPPPKEMPPSVIRACIASGVLIVVGTWLFWVVVRVPWATMLVGWVLICGSAGAIGLLYSRFLRQQLTDEAGAEADRSRHPGFSSFNVLAGDPGTLAERSPPAARPTKTSRRRPPRRKL
jgi:hypothetical protein